MKIAIVGAAGTGKTRLADELARHCPTALITDSPPLLAVMAGGLPFDPVALHEIACEHQRSYDLTLLTGLDLPFPHGNAANGSALPREQTDVLLRQTMQLKGIVFSVVYGSGPQRMLSALRLISGGDSPGPAWGWSCEKCSDPDCEYRLFTGLRNLRAAERPLP